MPEQRALEPAAPWIELRTTAADWDAADPALLATMLEPACTSSAPSRSACSSSPARASSTAPRTPASARRAARSARSSGCDRRRPVNGSHRGHHQFLAKALTHVAPGRARPDAAPLTPRCRPLLQRTLAEILGLAQGFCRGRGGSMHLQWLEAGALGTNAIVGGGVPLAAGSAWAHRSAGHRRRHRHATSATVPSTSARCSRRSTSRPPGSCRSASSSRTTTTPSRPPSTEATGEPRLSARGLGFGIPSWRVDGMDPLAVHLAMQARARRTCARARARRVIEADVYRFFHQNGPFPGSAFGYRTQGGGGASGAPATRSTGSRRQMLRRGLLDEDGVDARCASSAEAAMDAAVGELARARPGRQARQSAGSGPDLWPRPGLRRRRHPRRPGRARRRARTDEDGDVHRRRSRTQVHRRRRRRHGPADGDRPAHRRARRGRAPAQRRHQRRHQGLVQDVSRPRARHARSARTPSPASAAASPSTAGSGPVVEFMYPDFMWVAADQVFNQIGKARHMFGGDERRCRSSCARKVAMGTGYGSQHSMDPAGIFATRPGWRIIAPSTPFDYVGLMNAALACDDPVLVLEHVDLYASTGDGSERRPRLPDLPVGKAAVRRTGRRRHRPDATSSMVADVARGRRADRGRRRGHRPALARPGQHRLGDHRREHREDQQRAHRRAGRAGHLLRRLAGRRDPAAATSTGSTSRCSG